MKKISLLIFLSASILYSKAEDITKEGKNDNYLHTLREKEQVNPTQVKDIYDFSTIRHLVEKNITDKFPSTRFVDVHYGLNAGSDIRPKNNAYGLQNGENYSNNNLSLNLNMPVYKLNRFVFFVTGGLDYNNIGLEFPETNLIPYKSKTINSLSYRAGASTLYISHIQRKLIVAMVNLGVQGSKKGTERFIAHMFVTMLLKKTADEEITIGLFGLFSKTSNLPPLPIFGYKKQLSDVWSLDLFLPRYAYLRRDVLKNSRISMGTQLNLKRIYYNDETPFGQKVQIKNNDVKLGFLYEHHLTERSIISVATGVRFNFRGEVIPNNAKSRDRLFKFSQNPAGYIDLTYSYNLFNQKRRR